MFINVLKGIQNVITIMIVLEDRLLLVPTGGKWIQGVLRRYGINNAEHEQKR